MKIQIYFSLFKIALTITILGFGIQAMSQYGGTSSFKEIMDTFKSSTTLVVQTGDEEFDKAFMEGMDKFWTLTSFETASTKEFNSKLSQDKYSFIFPSEMTISDGLSVQTYPVVILIMGGKKKLKEYIKPDYLAYGFIDNFDTEATVSDAAWRAEHIPATLHQYLEFRLTSLVKVWPKNLMPDVEKHYNTSNSEIKTKTLLIQKSKLGDETESILERDYPGEYKIVDRSEIEKAIENGEKDTCYLLPIYWRTKFIFIVDSETGKILYAAARSSGTSLKGKDVKKMIKAVGKD